MPCRHEHARLSLVSPSDISTIGSVNIAFEQSLSAKCCGAGAPRGQADPSDGDAPVQQVVRYIRVRVLPGPVTFVGGKLQGPERLLRVLPAGCVRSVPRHAQVMHASRLSCLVCVLRVSARVIHL